MWYDYRAQRQGRSVISESVTASCIFAAVFTSFSTNIHYKIVRFINIYKHNQGCVLHSAFRFPITSNVPVNTKIPKCTASEYCFKYIQQRIFHTVLWLESTAAYISFSVIHLEFSYNLNKLLVTLLSVSTSAFDSWSDWNCSHRHALLPSMEK